MLCDIDDFCKGCEPFDTLQRRKLSHAALHGTFSFLSAFSKNNQYTETKGVMRSGMAFAIRNMRHLESDYVEKKQTIKETRR